MFRKNAIALLEQEARLKALNQQFNAALNNMSQGLCMFDADKRVVICNQRYRDIYGLAASETRAGTSLRSILELCFLRGLHGDRPAEEYICARLAEGQEETIRIQELSDARSIRISRRPMPSGGWVTTHEDVTAQQNVARRIAHMARHDALTELGNRLHLRERLDEEINRVHPGSCLALHYLDLDRFKIVNDTLGHPIGDALLAAVGERLRRQCRTTDVVARLGGDEFAVLQLDVTDQSQAVAMAERLVEVIGASYQIQNHTIEIGTSIGIALTDADYGDANELIKKADMALYTAKDRGRGTVCVYVPEIQERHLARQSLEADLRQAIANDELSVNYQPVIKIATGAVKSFEALVRWTHPTRGMVSPAEFIPVAEECGIIPTIGEWVLRKACADASRWPAKIKVSVNVSAVQFKTIDVVALVDRVLADIGFAAERLILEITESTLLQGDEAILATLQQLRARGVSVVLDDFGTGYSSMSYLHRFPFSGIKIDRSFVRNSTARNDCTTILRAIAGLATSLGMTTVAEGVETEAELETVRDTGCTHVQGYLFSRPVPVAQVPALIEALTSSRRKAA